MVQTKILFNDLNQSLFDNFEEKNVKKENCIEVMTIVFVKI